MAGLSDYDRVYRGRSGDLRQFDSNLLDEYYDRDMIGPMNHSSFPFMSEEVPQPDNDIVLKKTVGICCGLVSLITENLLIHPFIVLRRQCQVNPLLTTYHLRPITLIPVMIRLHQTQGLNTLWKGIGSVLLIRGLTLGVEDLISKITPWPKEIHSESSIIAFGQHILLKCISIGIVSPFYSASLVETVQSEIASEKPGILDVFRDGCIRLLEVGTRGRIIPIYALLAPHIAYGVTKYLFGLIVRKVVILVMSLREARSRKKLGAYSREVSEDVIQDIGLHATLISMCATEVIFYPLETVIHRLHLQGTRTIIDNLDSGRSVIPLLTDYSGAFDCYRTIISNEGRLGLYKGFGALVLQFGIHFLVLKATKYILTEIGTILKAKLTGIKAPERKYY